MVNRSSIRQQIMKPGNKKIKKVMGEFKKRKLRSGNSKKRVTNRKQAIAIALSEARKLQKKRRSS
jgi:hypothetical protein|tara:strand:+ start:272 stop:466 length:195 start_codon:yes stop_codon:yes gene_type:complete